MTIDAAEMLRIGFLTELVEPSDLPARTEVHLAAIDAVDPGTAALMKRHLHQIADGQVDYQALGQAYRDSLRSPELLRRLNALLK